MSSIGIVAIIFLILFLAVVWWTAKKQANGLNSNKGISNEKLTSEQIRKAIEEIANLDTANRVELTDASRKSIDVDSVLERRSIKVNGTIGWNRTKKLFSIEDFLIWNKEHTSPTFQEMLLEMIKLKGLTNQEFYTKANIDRKLFSAIKNNRDYRPKKETVVACCFGLSAFKDEADLLLDLAGYSLSMGIQWDRAIAYCLEQEITDINQVNQILYDLNEKCLGY